MTRVHIASSRCASLAAIPPNALWAIIDTEPGRVSSWSRKLAHLGPRQSLAGRIDLTAESIEAAFNREIDRLGASTHSLWWTFSEVAERNPDSSDLLLHCSFILVLLELIASKPASDWLILVEDDAVLIALERNLCQRGSTVIRAGHNPLAYGLAPKQRSSARLVASLVAGAVRRWRFLNLLDKSCPGPVTPADLLVHTWITPRNANSAAEFRQTYFGRLPEWLRSRGIRLQYLLFPGSNLSLSQPCKLVAELGSGGELFSVRPFLGLKDIILASVKGLRLHKHRLARVSLGNADLTPVFQQALSTRGAAHRCVDAYLTYWAMRRAGMAKQLPPTILYTCENHVWEKALCRGTRDGGETRLIGYQHTTIVPHYLNFTPLESDRVQRAHPEIVLSNGAYWQRRLEEAGWPDVPLGAALRFPAQPAQRPEPGQSCVLVATPASLRAAVPFVRFCAEALADVAVPVTVKCHPATTPPAWLRAHLGFALPQHWRITVTGSMIEALQSASMLVYCFGAVGLEGLSQGVPVIAVALELELNRNPLRQLPEYEHTVISPEELRDRVEAILRGDVQAIPLDVVRQLWDRMFEPPTDDRLARIAELLAGPRRDLPDKLSLAQ